MCLSPPSTLSVHLLVAMSMTVVFAMMMFVAVMLAVFSMLMAVVLPGVVFGVIVIVWFWFGDRQARDGVDATSGKIACGMNKNTSRKSSSIGVASTDVARITIVSSPGTKNNAPTTIQRLPLKY